MNIRELEMTMRVKQKVIYSFKVSAWIIEYTDQAGNNHITASFNRNGEFSGRWYIGQGFGELLPEVNRLALLSDEDFAIAEEDEKYGFNVGLNK